MGRKTNEEIMEYLKDVYFGFVEGDHFIDYCNGYGDGYLNALGKEELITEQQVEKLREWNNSESQRWWAIAKKDCGINIAHKIGNKEEYRT